MMIPHPTMERSSKTIDALYNCASQSPHVFILCQFLRLRHYNFIYESTPLADEDYLIKGDLKIMIKQMICQNCGMSSLEQETCGLEPSNEEFEDLKSVILSTFAKVLSDVPNSILTTYQISKETILEFAESSTYLKMQCQNLKFAENPTYIWDKLILYRHPLIFRYHNLTAERRFELLRELSLDASDIEMDDT